MLYYVYLSGEHRTLPEAEVRAICEAEGIPFKVIAKFDQVLIIESTHEFPQYVSKRSALAKYLGILLGVTNIVEGSNGVIKAIRDSGIDLNAKELFVKFSRVKEFGKGFIEYDGLISKLKSEFKLRPLMGKRQEGIKILDIIVSNAVIIGLRLHERSMKVFDARAPQKRPEYRPGTLPPIISRVFVNLSRVSIRRNEFLLDPFCGVGGFLLEACSMGLNNYLGIDINHDYVQAARKNLIFYNCLDNIVCGDACSMSVSIGKVDAIATDPPYGRLTRPGGRGLRELMMCFMEEASKVLRKGSYMVFAQRKGVINEDDIESINGLAVVEKHLNWVHGSLTRDIYVVKVK